MRWSRRRVGAGIAAIALACTVFAVAQAEPSPPRPKARVIAVTRPAPPGTRVAVLGDSISYLTVPAYQERFAARRFVVPVISGIPGIRSDERVTEGPALIAPSSPTVLVLELGTNDVGKFLEDHPNGTDAELAAFARQVAQNQLRIADAVGPQLACVVVVNISGNTMSPRANEVAHAENRALLDWSRGDDRVRIANWDSLMAHELAMREPGGSMTSDMVHPTPHGAARLAALVEETIDTCPSI